MHETFRPKSNLAWAGASMVLIALFATNSFIVAHDSLQIAREWALCAILGSLVYMLWIRPKLVLGDEVIIVVNPLGTERIPYRDVLDLETKWALTIVHNRGRTIVWVAPASGKGKWIADNRFRRLGSGVPLSDSAYGNSETMSASLDSVSGQAAYLIRERIKRLH